MLVAEIVDHIASGGIVESFATGDPGGEWWPVIAVVKADGERVNYAMVVPFGTSEIAAEMAHRFVQLICQLFIGQELDSWCVNPN